MCSWVIGGAERKWKYLIKCGLALSRRFSCETEFNPKGRRGNRPSNKFLESHLKFEWVLHCKAERSQPSVGHHISYQKLMKVLKMQEIETRRPLTFVHTENEPRVFNSHTQFENLKRPYRRWNLFRLFRPKAENPLDLGAMSLRNSEIS